MDAKAKFAVMMREHVQPRLETFGLRRARKWEFERWDGDCFSTIGVSCGKMRGHDAVPVSMGVSVGFRSIAEFWWGSPLFATRFVKPEDIPENPKRPHMLGGELMLLSRGGVDALRVIDEHVMVEDAAREILGEIEQHGIPFLEQHRDLERAIEAWRAWKMVTLRPYGPACVAAGLWLLGRHDEARAVVDEELERARRRYEERQNPIRRRDLDSSQLLHDEFTRRTQQK